MDGYFKYYSRVVQTEKNGLKLVLGGTGLGKTRGIRHLINNGKSGERKFVYVANRIQLLNEMYDDLTRKSPNPNDPSYPELSPKEIVHLERNRDTVINALEPEYRDHFFELLKNTPIVTQIASALRLDTVSIEKSCKQVIQIQKLLSDGQLDYSVSDFMERNLETYTREILAYFRLVTTRAKDDDKSWLLNHPIIQILFPYIAFAHNENTRVLLLTIHKGFLGFFDGSKTMNLTQLKNCIVFLDEFDFLESDLIDLISRSAQIEDPFLFVDMFHQAMTRHKLPLETYPFPANASQKVDNIQTTIRAIVNRINQLKSEKGIRFPEINQFTTSIKEKHAAIFQTNRMVLKRPLYLRETARSFEILTEPQEKTLDTLELFNTVQWATNRILFLFNDIAAISSRMYEEMLSHCFPQSYLADQVRQASQFPHSYEIQYTRFGNLLSLGYGVYEIQDLEQITDEEEVKFRLYSIRTTPERIILSIASKNVVFGLSATADLPRLVKHFNIAWLKQQLIETDGADYFDIDDYDEDIIQNLNEAKLNKRKNTIFLEFVQFLADYDDGTKIRRYIQQIAKHFPDGFGKDDKNGFRRARVENFFSILYWIIKNRTQVELKSDTHLLFYNSFKQIHFLLSNPECHEGLDWLNVEKLRFNNKHFEAYCIKFFGNSFNVVFYDALQAKSIQNANDVKSAYHRLFWDEVPVLVITQYASAGNGVNLQYKPAENMPETDFANIHLLDTPFFFFDQINTAKDTVPDVDSAIKKNLWYQAKLYEGKIISQGKFFSLLENMRGRDFNREYNYSRNEALNADSLSNRMATYVQAIGRFERVWASVRDQWVFMTLDVFNDFSMFYLDESYYEIREKRRNRISNNLQQLISQVEIQGRNINREAKRAADTSLAQQEAKCKSAVHELLKQLERYRLGQDTEAKEAWLDLRTAALKHDFASTLLNEYHATFRSTYNENGLLYIDRDNKVYPHNLRVPSARRWRLNSVYDVIKGNKVISQHFLSRGYELEFSQSTDFFFTPYFYQAILVGAIGEAAIEHLLKTNLVVLDEIPHQLFELADLKIEGKAWYIDCKNYSEKTLDQFPLDEDDPAYHPSLSEETFEGKARLKIQRIKAFHKGQKDDCKLIYLNLVSSEDRSLRYINSRNFAEDTSFDEADVVIVQGIIHPDKPNELSSSFKQFLDDYLYRT